MAKDLGWIKLHRSSFNNKLYFSEKFTRWQAWADLLLSANHSEGWVRVRGIKQEILRGQVGFSIPELMNRWVWSKGKVLRYLNELVNERQIVLQKNNITTLISIVNYNKYQIDDTADSTANEPANEPANGSADGPQTDPQTFISTMNTKELQAPKNDKNDKKEINKNIPVGTLPFKIYPLYSDFNGLRERTQMDFVRLVKATKQIDVEIDTVNILWEVFKNQSLTGKKEYDDDEGVYRHFINWGIKQPFRKKTIPKKQKDDKKIIGVKFINNFTQCEMSDGSIQELTKNQIDGATYNQINPNSIVKK